MAIESLLSYFFIRGALQQVNKFYHAERSEWFASDGEVKEVPFIAVGEHIKVENVWSSNVIHGNWKQKEYAKIFRLCRLHDILLLHLSSRTRIIACLLYDWGE